MTGATGVTTSSRTIQGDEIDILTFVAEPGRRDDDRVLIVVPENPGITEWRQRETARMAADLGWVVVVMNTYSRIGGVPPAGPFETHDDRRRAAFLAMPDEQVARDLVATTDWARQQWSLGTRRPALLGFCSGGGQALYAAATHQSLVDCVVAIYGNVILPGALTADRRPLNRIGLVQHLDSPLQLHVGTQDVAIPMADVDELKAELARAGRRFEIHRYEGANHVFSDETHPNHDPQATATMWPRVYAFLREHTR
jgi:carboxymethylenebutenolidase